MDQLEDDPLEFIRLDLSLQAVATDTERLWKASRYESEAMEIAGGLDREMRVSEG